MEAKTDYIAILLTINELEITPKVEVVNKRVNRLRNKTLQPFAEKCERCSLSF